MAAWFAIISFPIAAAIQVTLTPAVGEPQQAVEVKVTLTNEEVLSGLQLLFEVPEGSGLTLTQAQALGRAAHFSAKAGIRDGRASVMLFQTNGSTIAKGSGEVARFTVQFSDRPVRASLPVTVKATNAAGQALSCPAANLQVTCHQAQAEYTTRTIDFGRVALRTQPVQYLSVQNVGTAPLVIRSAACSLPEFKVLNLPLTIAPHESGTLEVQFQPTERGEQTAELDLVCNSPTTSNKIYLKAQPYAVNEIHIGNAQGTSDEIVTLQVSMNNMDPINGFTLEMEMPEALEYVDGSFALSNRSQGHELRVNMVGRRLKVNAFSLQNKTFTGHEGVLASFKVQLKGKGTIPLNPAKVALGAFYKGQVQNVVSASYGGNIEISYPTIGLNAQLDLGRTPITQTASIPLLINNYGSAPLVISKVLIDNPNLKLNTPLPLTIPSWGDKNLDLSISSLQEGKIEGLLQVYSNDPDQRMVNVTFAGERYSPNHLNFGRVSTPQNSKEIKVAVTLENNDAISGFQFDVHHPQGLTAKDEITWSERTKDFTMNHRTVGPHTERYFIYSLAGKSIPRGKGKVFELRFNVATPLSQGQHPMRISNIKLSTPQLEDKHSQLNDEVVQLIIAPNFRLIESLQLNTAEQTCRLDETVQLTAIIQPANATYKTLKWTSSDKRIANVDFQGHILPKNIGKTTITATTTDGSNISASCTVIVLDPVGIETIVSDEQETVIYTIRGERIYTDYKLLKPGWYIINGHKVLITRKRP